MGSRMNPRCFTLRNGLNWIQIQFDPHSKT